MKKLILFLFVSVGLLLADTRVYHKKVDVIRSEPVYKTITRSIPYEECYDEVYEQKVPTYSNNRESKEKNHALNNLILLYYTIHACLSRDFP